MTNKPCLHCAFLDTLNKFADEHGTDTDAEGRKLLPVDLMIGALCALLSEVIAQAPLQQQSALVQRTMMTLAMNFAVRSIGLPEEPHDHTIN